MCDIKFSEEYKKAFSECYRIEMDFTKALFDSFNEMRTNMEKDNVSVDDRTKWYWRWFPIENEELMLQRGCSPEFFGDETYSEDINKSEIDDTVRFGDIVIMYMKIQCSESRQIDQILIFRESMYVEYKKKED